MDRTGQKVKLLHEPKTANIYYCLLEILKHDQ